MAEKDKELSRYVMIDRQTGKAENVSDNYKTSSLPGNLRTEGVVIRKSVPSVMKYLRTAKEYALYEDEDIYEQIRLSNIMYYRESLVGTAIDIFVDYADTEMSIEGLPDGKEEDLCNWWLEHVNETHENMESGVNALTAEEMLEYWCAGNVFPFRAYEEKTSLELGLTKTMRRRKLEIPTQVYLINPLFIKIPEDEISFGRKNIYLSLNEEDRSSIRRKDARGVGIIDSMPASLTEGITSEGDILIPKELISHIKRKSRGYQAWGVPYLIRAFGPYARKKKLQALDEATIDGLVNNVTIYKVGDPKDPSTWSAARIRAFANLINNPDATNAVVWAPDVSTETVQPNADILSFDKKYQQVDKNVLQAINVPTSLISGEGISTDSKENIWVQVSSLMEKIEAARKQIKRDIEKTLFNMLERNNLSTENKPQIRWRKVNLRNENEFRDFVITLFDRGLLDIETTIHESGYAFDEILKKRLEEHKTKVSDMTYKEIFDRRDTLPFSAPGEPPSGDKKGKGRPKRGEEKSKTTPKTSTKPKNTKPK
jgi:hypothetical protein